MTKSEGMREFLNEVNSITLELEKGNIANLQKRKKEVDVILKDEPTLKEEDLVNAIIRDLNEINSQSFDLPETKKKISEIKASVAGLVNMFKSGFFEEEQRKAM